MSILSAATLARTERMKKPDASLSPLLANCSNSDLLLEVGRRIGSHALELAQVIDAAGYDEVDVLALADARDWWRRGDKREALHYLDIALGREFSGLADLKPEDLT